MRCVWDPLWSEYALQGLCLSERRLALISRDRKRQCLATHGRFDEPGWIIRSLSPHWAGSSKPQYSSHEALDEDRAVQEETRKVARSVVQTVKELRAGRLSQPDKQVKALRAK